MVEWKIIIPFITSQKFSLDTFSSFVNCCDKYDVQSTHSTKTFNNHKTRLIGSLILRISLQFLGSFKYQFVASFTESVFK